MSYPRANRIAEEIKKIASYAILNELRDPRISPMTTIVDVQVTRDIRYATIYVSVLGTEKDKEDTLEGLKKGSGYMRKLIGQKIKTHYTPEVIFRLDESIERGVHMYKVINEVNKQNNDTEVNPKEDEGNE